MIGFMIITEHVLVSSPDSHALIARRELSTFMEYAKVYQKQWSCGLSDCLAVRWKRKMDDSTTTASLYVSQSIASNG